MFAHDKAQYGLNVPESLVYCIAFDPPSSTANPKTGSLFAPVRTRESRLYSSTDFFDKDNTYVDLSIGKAASGVVGIGGVQKFLVVALKPDATSGAGGVPGEMVLFVTEDGQTWSRALFPHGHGLAENAYTIVESTQHSILVDVNSAPSSATGTLFTSNSNGSMFTRSLEHTNRNKAGIVDFEKLVGVEGVSVCNTVGNWEEVEGKGGDKQLKSMITFDDGRSRYSLVQ